MPICCPATFGGMSEPGGEGASRIPLSVASVLGHPGADVNAWGMSKKDGKDKYIRCRHPSPGGVLAQEWPLPELTLEAIASRWGHGEFRVIWLINDPENEDVSQRRRSGGSGVPFTLEAPEAVAVALPSPAQASAAPSSGRLPLGLEGFEGVLQLMTLFDQRSQQQVRGMVEVAQVMTGRSSGLDAQTLTLLLERQDRNTRELVQSMQTAHNEQMSAIRAQIAALQSEDEEDDDDEEEEAPAVAVVRAAAPLFKAGKPIGDGVKAAIGNYLAENPGVIFDVLKAAPKLVEQFSNLAAQQQQQQAQQPTTVVTPPPASPQARPRAMPRAQVVRTPMQEQQAVMSGAGTPPPSSTRIAVDGAAPAAS